MPDTFEILSPEQQVQVRKICRTLYPQAKSDADITFALTEDGEQRIIIKGKGRSWSYWNDEVAKKCHHYSEYKIGVMDESNNPVPRTENLTETTDKAELLFTATMGNTLSDRLNHHTVRVNDLFWSRGIFGDEEV